MLGSYLNSCQKLNFAGWNNTTIAKVTESVLQDMFQKSIPPDILIDFVSR